MEADGERLQDVKETEETLIVSVYKRLYIDP